MEAITQIQYRQKCVIWNDIITAVEQRKSVGCKTNLFSEDDEGSNAFYEAMQKLILQTTENLKQVNRTNHLALKKRYKLGAKYCGVYFTRREAECMVWLLKGITIGNIGIKLNISSRTIEYYVNSMKTKVGCRTKIELINLINASEFMQGIDFAD
jgi:DNA-binding CsgD family transcriptional regulator